MARPNLSDVLAVRGPKVRLDTISADQVSSTTHPTTLNIYRIYRSIYSKYNAAAFVTNTNPCLRDFKTIPDKPQQEILAVNANSIILILKKFFFSYFELSTTNEQQRRRVECSILSGNTWSSFNQAFLQVHSNGSGKGKSTLIPGYLVSSTNTARATPLRSKKKWRLLVV